jgi:hypothetical protein
MAMVTDESMPPETSTTALGDDDVVGMSHLETEL